MKSSLNIIFSLSLILLVLIKTKVDCCACEQLPKEALYCKSDWTSKVLILSKREVDLGDCYDCGRVIYEVRHLQKFKFPKKVVLSKVNKIRTSNETGFCGMPNLKVGHEYILAGTMDEKFKFRTGTCLGVRLNGKKSEKQLKLWKKYFYCK